MDCVGVGLLRFAVTLVLLSACLVRCAGWVHYEILYYEAMLFTGGIFMVLYRRYIGEIRAVHFLGWRTQMPLLSCHTAISH